MKVRENINPCRPFVAAMVSQTDYIIYASPDRKEVCRNTGDNQVPILRHCSFRWLQQAVSGGEVVKFLAGQCVPEHGQPPIQSYGIDSVPDAHHKAMAVVGVQHCP